MGEPKRHRKSKTNFVYKIEIEKEAVQMKWKIVNGILVCIVGLEIVSLAQEIKIESRLQELETKTQTQFLNSKTETENSISNDDIPASGYAGHFSYDEYDSMWPEYDKYIVECIVAGEAKGEPIEGKMAVAQCILNGMVKSNWSAERVRIEYQYSGWDDELENANPEAWAEVVEAVSRVFDDGELISDKPILYFYAPDITSSSWHESLNHAVTIEGHKFFYLNEDVNADWFLNLRKDV